MSGPRDPNDVAEQALEEHRRLYPTEADYERAVADGIRMSDEQCMSDFDDEYYDDRRLAPEN